MRYTLSFMFFASLVYGHGKVTSPPTRTPGAAMKAACGQQVFNNQASNGQGNVQNEVQIAQGQKDYNPAECQLFLCKGYMFADQPQANIQHFAPGQVVTIEAEISAPHTGTCNVSVVSTRTNSVLAGPLIYFSDYASNAHAIPANNTKFDITIPTTLEDQCATAGDCVVQWHWDARDVSQTYQSCVDFTMGGGSAGTAFGNSTAPGGSETAHNDDAVNERRHARDF